LGRWRPRERTPGALSTTRTINRQNLLGAAHVLSSLSLQVSSLHMTSARIRCSMVG